MKKKLLLTRMLLLVALLVGSVSAWGADVIVISEDFSTNNTADKLTAAGWTLSGKTSFPSTGSLQIASSSGAGSATTPAFSTLVGTTATLSVTHISSGGSTRTMTITGVNCKVNGNASTTVTVPANSSDPTTSTISITEASTISQIRFSLPSKQGTIINEVVVSYTPSTDPVISATSPVEIECDATSGEFGYTLNNTVDGGVLSAAAADGDDWISNVAVDTENKKVTFSTTANSNPTPREGTITMTYKKGGETLASKEVTISQAEYVVLLKYTKATRVVPGRHYIITSGIDGSIKAMGADRGNNHGSVGLTASENKTSFYSNEGVCELIIGGDMETGYYTLYDVGVKKYISAASSGSNNMKYVTTLDGDAKWTIDIDGTGKAVIQSQGDYSRNTIRHNSGNNPPLFSCYESTKQDDIYLFERDGDTSVQEFPVTISDKKYATFASYFDLDFTGVSGLYAYTATVVAGNKITFNKVTKAKAGEGLLLYSETAKTYNVPVATDSPEAVSGNKLVRGTGAAVSSDGEGETKNYVLSSKGAGDVNFYLANGNEVPKDKAYLKNIPASAPSKFFLPTGEDETDGIRSIENSELRIENSNYYNLAGQRVGKDYKGIVIVNGKKMLNK